MIRMQRLGHVTAVSTLLETVDLPEPEPCLLGACVLMMGRVILKWLRSVNFCQSLFPIVFWCFFFLGRLLLGKLPVFFDFSFSQMLMTKLVLF